jgi:hypothetical protein
LKPQKYMTTGKPTAPFAAALAVLLLSHACAQTILVDENWQTPLFSNNELRSSGDFTGWMNNGGLYSSREDNAGDVPGDTTGPFPNQVIKLNGNATYAEIDIAHTWAPTDVFTLRVEASPAEWGGQNQRYIRPELHQQDGTVLWIAPEDASTAVPLYDNFGAMTDWPSELTFWFTIDASTFAAGTAGQSIRLRLDASGQRSLNINNVKLALGPLPADNTAPAPDPLTWDISPTVSNFIDIAMKANSARDPGDLYDVEYYFENTVSGSTSGWQHARTWSESGLDYDTLYTYRVKARDTSPNQNASTSWSSEVNVTTLPRDQSAPSPDPLTWQVVPEVGDYGTITMTVDPATDPAGVEYYFENTVKGSNSGWQDSNTWTEGDLDHDTLYTYRAKARDRSPDQNVSTTWSSEESATTWSVPAGTLVITGFQSPLLSEGTGNPSFAGWTWFNGGSVKSRRSPSNGLPGDPSVPGTNQGIQLEWTTAEAQYDISHNWSSNDVYTLTVNAAPQDWNKANQRYIRPSLRQQDGTVLWAPGENLSGPEKTALPKDLSFGGSTWQAEPDLTFTFTIDAGTFTAGTAGQPIVLRLDSSGQRGLYVDNVTLSVSGGGGDPYSDWAISRGLDGTNNGFDQDPEGDQLANGLEWILGGNPLVQDAAGLWPAAGDANGGLTLTFTRAEDSIGEVSLSVDWDVDLEGTWANTIPIVDDILPSGDNPSVDIDTAAAPDSVTVTIPVGNAVAGKIFARLRATQP